MSRRRRSDGRRVAVMSWWHVASGRGDVGRQSRVSGGGVVTIARVVDIVSAWHRGGITWHSPWLGIHVGDMRHRPRGRDTVGHQWRGRGVGTGSLGYGRGVADRSRSPGWCVAGHWHRRPGPGLGGCGCSVMARVVDSEGRHPGERGGDRGHAGDQGHAGEGGGGPDRGRGEGPRRRGGWRAVHFT